MSSGIGNPPVALGQKVFICYRREETAAHAGRIYDTMVARFGERNVFMDVEIEPGVDFVERITTVVSSCEVLIVVMGRDWATVEGPDGAPRLAEPEDFVRLEVETALRRPEVTPIPVLVSGARMPRPEQLPEPLRPLTRRNALELSDARWRYDVGRLQGALDRLLGEVTFGIGAEPPAPEPFPTPTPAPPPAAAAPPTPASSAAPVPAPRPTRRRVARPAPREAGETWRVPLEGALLAAGTAALGRLLAEPLDGVLENAMQDLGASFDVYEVVSLAMRRAVTWALVGAALAIWLVLRARRGELRRPLATGLLVGAGAGLIGGLVYAVPALLPEENLTHSSLALAHLLDGFSVAVTGGLLGAMIAAAWRPARPPGAAVAAAALAGGLSQLLLLQTLQGEPPTGVTVLFFALEAAAIAAAALAVLSRPGRFAQPAAPE